MDIKLDISMLDSDLTTIPDGYFIDYDIYVYDEDGTFIKRYSSGDIVREDVVIWRGATLEVVGLFRAKDEYQEDGTVIYAETKSISETEVISESDMREDYYDGEYFNIRTSLRKYDPDKD